ncbi:MAG: glycosyltransferase [Phycisphaerales bacterium]|nr:glycosyltransferase [Phycisphaerales bacterium]
MSNTPAPAPFLIPLPRGMFAGGVITWAVRTAAALAQRGRDVCLLSHREDPGVQRLHPQLPPNAAIIDLTHLPPVEGCNGNLAPYIPIYRDAIRMLVGRTRRPAVLAPTLLGDCFGIAAALSMVDPECIRIVGWQHSPIPYDGAVLARYEPAISLFVPVSEQIAASLRTGIPYRAADIRTIHHGIAAPKVVPARPELTGRPLRLIYAGRMENDLKRVMSLLSISDALAAGKIDHRLTLIGDGPASAEIDAGIRSSDREGRIRRLEPLRPEDVQRMLMEHDVFVLPSRIEGLSMSVLEAMAQGCVPVITRTPSGAGTLVEHGVSGMLVDVDEQPTKPQLANQFASAICSAIDFGIPKLSAAAHARVRDRFSMDEYTSAVERIIEDAAAMPPRPWPADRTPAFTSAGARLAGSGAVPADGAARLAALLATLAGKSIIIHGTGRHTIELASTLANSPARIVAFTDDDPKRHGLMLWNWPIIPPTGAGRTGASDVVISSWMNQDVIWDRRSVYDEQGMVVHRLYV